MAVKQYELNVDEIPVLELASRESQAALKQTEAANQATEQAFRDQWWGLLQNPPTFSLWEKLYIRGALSEERIPLLLAAKQYRLNHPLK